MRFVCYLKVIPIQRFLSKAFFVGITFEEKVEFFRFGSNPEQKVFGSGIIFPDKSGCVCVRAGVWLAGWL